MTNKELDLINAIDNFEISSENIPIEVIQAYSKLRSKINEISKLEQPNFTKNNKLIEMKYWNDWKFTGLHAWEFIDTDFYKYGFQDKSDLEDY